MSACISALENVLDIADIVRDRDITTVENLATVSAAILASLEFL
jgi:hypothetical protein